MTNHDGAAFLEFQVMAYIEGDVADISVGRHILIEYQVYIFDH